MVQAISRNLQYEETSDNEYANIYRSAIMKSQKDSIRLMKAGLVQSGSYENTPEDILDEYEDDEGMDLNLFNDLNGF